MRREQTCCFTGHRPNKLPWGADEQDKRCVQLKQRIDHELHRAYYDGVRHFICGMAQGADFYFCEAAIALRDDMPGVTIEAAIPCETQSAYWSQEDQLRYRHLVEHCDYETVVQRKYDKGCMYRRNRYMVDHSSRLIAAFDGRKGGSMYTIAYAMKQKLDVILLEIE